MSTLLTLLCAVTTVLLAVPRHPQRALPERLGARSPSVRAGLARRVLTVLVMVLAVVGTLGAAYAVAGASGTVVACAGLIVVVTAATLVNSFIRQRRTRRAQNDVARACSVLASYLRVGQVATEALTRSATDCPVLVEAARILEIGGDVPAAWRTQAQRPGCAGLADLARAWEVATRTGAPLSASLEQVATALAADQTLRTVVAGELSAPRATGKVMAVLPLLGLGLGYLLGGDPLQWLLAGPIGWACLLLGLTLGAVGVTWIERLASAAAAQG